MRSIIMTAVIGVTMVICAQAAHKKSGKAYLTNFESYPADGSPECIDNNGCKWKGQFAFVKDKQTEEWVKSHYIIALHSKDAKKYKLKTFRITQGKNQIDAKVYDECRDKDCGGCCTRNRKKAGFLIDMEKYTLKRFGGKDGIVEWKCLDC